MYLLATAVLLCLYIASSAFPFDDKEIKFKTIGNTILSDSSILNADYIPRRNCKELLDEGHTKTGLYKIQPVPTSFEFVVFCDMDLQGGGWTVIMRRVNEEENFNRTWDMYASGFGSLAGNFFLGLERIRLLTEAGDIELHVGLGHHIEFPSKDAYKTAHYSSFQVGSSVSHYKLAVSGFDNSSTAGDSLTDHSGRSFSTYDEDHDNHESMACAERYSGGWWFHDCFESNLSGKFYKGDIPDRKSDGIIWKSWTGEHYSLKTAVMAIRPSSTV